MSKVYSYLNKGKYFCLISVFLFLISCKKDKKSVEILFSNFSLETQTFPDFSFAGYQNSEVKIPDLPVTLTISPILGDNYENIQNAIDEISKLPLINGFRGVILLKSGQYNISNTLIISKNGVVLRGEGQTNNKTVINITKRYDFTRIASLKKTAALKIEGSEKRTVFMGAKTTILADAKMGESTVKVEQASSFKKGDTIEIVQKTNQEWINFLNMSQYGWTPDQYQITHKRIVTSVNGDYLTINIPLVDNISLKFGGGEVVKVRYEGGINNCGVENLKFTTIYDSNEDENHAWNAVMLTNAKNCWVRNVTAEHFSFAAVALSQSRNITIQDCAILNFKSKPIGDRRYSFAIEHSSSNILIQRCYSERGRHDFVTGSKVPGPNVFLDCVAVNSLSDTGPHHRWATGTLFDNIKANKINAKNSKGGGSGHGWTGAFTMFWNNQALHGFIIQSPPSAENWLVGAKGNISYDSNGHIMNPGTNVLPRSLFISQLRKRIGDVKLYDIIVPEQDGDLPIWDKLETWRGGENSLKKL